MSEDLNQIVNDNIQPWLQKYAGSIEATFKLNLIVVRSV